MLVVGWKTAHLAKPGTLARKTGRQVGIGVTSGTVAGLAAADLAAGASVAGAAGSGRMLRRRRGQRRLVRHLKEISYRFRSLMTYDEQNE